MAAFMRGMLCHLHNVERAIILRGGNDYIVESKRYVRGLRRKPVNVLYPDSETGPRSQQRSDQMNKLAQSMPVGHKKVKEPRSPAKTVPNASVHGTTNTVPNASVRGNFKAEASKKNNFTPFKSGSQRSDSVSSTTTSEHETTSKDQIGGLRFERAFPGDKRLARVASVARSRTYREHQGKVLLEGRRLICDALAAGANPQMVFFSSAEKLSELPLDRLKRATLVRVKYEEIKIWSNLVAPQGLIAIFARPDPSRLTFPKDPSADSVPLSLICDNVRDPGNLGTILRCAAAAGCQDVLLTKGCVDAWEPKVLRSAMGAHFRVPIFPSLDWNDIERHLPDPITVHVADNRSGSERAEREVEDLPVKESSQPSKAGDYGWVSSRPNRKNMRHEEYDSDSDSDTDSGDEDGELSLPRVDARLYHDSWAQRSTALVIGGETRGLSVEAVKLAEKTAGQRLFIPVVPGVDSLNSAMAASILLFEGRRQLLNLMETSRRTAKAKVQQ